ncbi:uncharacterized protein G2W53_007014 [Senna tora]|uniref:Uncharacterized protein n=1 Tax=Senna tora TaxID=362788 RepID=A0A835CGZ8_9FABA|nr:uncharacterized protein G2W53_007014 [Senna tora]
MQVSMQVKKQLAHHEKWASHGNPGQLIPSAYEFNGQQAKQDNHLLFEVVGAGFGISGSGAAGLGISSAAAAAGGFVVSFRLCDGSDSFSFSGSFFKDKECLAEPALL